ncbi:hypothetical protein F5Y09DRAFT_350030 [Xylaria sp. FL1042]|nr:hypothetical protein F5Y09DRAFT_350030 [Xylaria sp. FL1042]
MPSISMNQAGIRDPAEISITDYSTNHADVLYDYVVQFPVNGSSASGTDAGSYQYNQPHAGYPYSPDQMTPYSTPVGQRVCEYLDLDDNGYIASTTMDPPMITPLNLPSASAQAFNYLAGHWAWDHQMGFPNPTVSRQQSHGKKRALDEDRDEVDNEPPGKKSRKANKKNDGRPKKATNMFLCFRRAHSQQLKAENPGITNGEISSTLAKRWKAMSDAEKQPWKDQAARLKSGQEQLTQIVLPQAESSRQVVSTPEQNQPQEQPGTTQQPEYPYNYSTLNSLSEIDTQYNKESIAYSVTSVALEEHPEYNEGLTPGFVLDDPQSLTHLTSGTVTGEKAQHIQEHSIDFLVSLLAEDNAQYSQESQFTTDTMTENILYDQESLVRLITGEIGDVQHISEKETTHFTAGAPSDEQTLGFGECANEKSVDGVELSFDFDLPGNFLNESLGLDCDDNFWSLLGCQNSDFNLPDC